jgi:hypothetical protein
VVALALGVSSASAAPSAAPGWRIDSVAAPTNFSEGDNAECLAAGEGVGQDNLPCDRYEVSAMNAGSEPTNGGSVTLTDTLPKGPLGEELLTTRRVKLFLVETGNAINDSQQLGGETLGESQLRELGYAVACTTAPVRCTYSHALAPGDRLVMKVFVAVNAGAAGSLTNVAEVSGGGARSVSSDQPGQMQQTNRIDSESAPFGVSNFNFFKDALDGGEETQAGGHPYALTTTIDLNNALRNEISQGPGKGQGIPSSEDVKDIVVDLPLGFVGSTLAAPTCTEAQLDSTAHCPPDTVVGHLTTEPRTNLTTINGPIWNIAPERGHPAEFGFIDSLKSTHVAGYVSVVPTPAGYVLRFVAPDIPEINLSRLVVTFYGDPAEEQTETQQQETEREVGHPVKREDAGVQVPFFTNPTACSNGPQVATIWADSWHDPAHFDADGLTPTDLGESAWKQASSESPPVNGCNALSFTPTLGAQPTTHEADKPTGLEFEQRLPQSEAFGTNATPALKDTTIMFPEGMTVDPSSADGLGVCTDAQIGWTGPTPLDFTQAPPECPESSKIGTLELETPLIAGKLYGEVFLAAQNENPFGSTFATYIVVNDPVTGVVLKLAGELKSDPGTGRLTAVFDDTPQLPFSALKVHFFGGPRAELATPPSCGVYTTTSELEPWSFPDSGLAATPFDSYTIDENCAIGFAPAFTGGSTNLQAGAYTTFQASFERQDNDQELAGATINLPPGMVADVPSVTECGEAELRAEEADAPGGCPASSQVGTVRAGAGPGPNPLFVPGKVFWTGPYNGGPFGLAVVVSANPGPFHFGNVVVRQSIRVNPLTAAVTDVSAPFPRYLDPVGPNGQTAGIPIKLRRVDVEINRPGFTFNPTNCAKETFKVGGQITSVNGASKTLATPFQVTNCAHLKFAPKFSVSTSGKTSKQDGASLTYRVSYPNAPQGTEADIGYVKVELPSELPSRLTTLQKACTAKQFDANPADCPTPSVIGHAIVHTPILPTPLEGPVYFVSNGGEAFPNLEMVLQGDGVTVDLIGDTLIKNGVTSTTFKAVPDAPFSTFEINLPEGKYSALAANANLCKPTVTKTVKKNVRVQVNGRMRTVTRKVKEQVATSLTIPSDYIAQNGATYNAKVPITVTGCAKVKRAKKTKRKAKEKTTKK